MAFRKLNRVGLPGEHRYNRGTDEEPLLYSSKGEQQIMQTKSGQRWSVFWTLITITAALAAVTALIVGSIALRNTNEGLIGKISNLTVTNLTVLNTATIDRLVINMNVTTLTALTATVQNLFASVVNATSAVFGSVSVTNLSTNMLSFVPLSVTTNIVLPATHNTFHLSHTSTGLNVTLPADLTLMIGKEIQVCNADGKRHVLDATPVGKWDTKNFWSVIRFDQNSAGCCVTFKVLTASKVSLISRSEQCTTFCATNDLYHCVDVERPEATNPWHGWWKSALKNRFPTVYRTPESPYAFVNASQVPVTITYYAGQVNAPRYPTQYDRANRQLRVHSLYFIGASNILSDDPDTNLIKSDNYDTYAMVMQADGSFIQHRLDLSNEFQYFDANVGWYQRIDEKNIPKMIPSTSGTLDLTIPDDPQSIFKSYVNAMLYSGNAHITAELNDEKFIGEPAARQLADRLMATGTTHSTSVYQIFTTQFPVEGLTRIRTVDYHHVVPPAKVIISGCTGSWAPMNGVHQISAGMTTNSILMDPTFADYSATNPAQRSLHHDVVIFFNTTGFPTDGATGLGTSTGPCELTVAYGPLTSASEYDETQSVLLYWAYESFKVIQHSYLSMLVDGTSFTPFGQVNTRKSLTTWNSVQAAIDAGTAISVNIRTRANGPASSYYIMQTRNDVVLGATKLDDRSITFDFNNRFGVRPDIDAAPYILKENYLTDIRHLLIRCQQNGNVRTSDNNLFAGSVYGSLDGGCDTIEARVTAMGDIPAPSENYYMFTDSGVSVNGLSPEEYAYYSELYMFGKINTTYTNGVNIGYIRLSDIGFTDVFFFSWSEDFAPDATLGEDFRQMLNIVSIIAEMMKYLTVDLACEHVILDIRSNRGGFLELIHSLRSFFGSENDYSTNAELQALTGNNYAKLVNMTQFKYASDRFIPSATLQAQTRAIVIQTYFPDAVFQNGKVVIVNDVYSASAGDLFPNLFLGQNRDLNLGANTTVKIIGDLDGRLSGCGVGGFSSPTAADGPRIRNTNGTPRPGWIGRMDSACRRSRSDGSSMANRHPSLAPACTPTLRGLAGGCPLPNDMESLLFPDLGYKPNYRARLPGDDRATTPTPSIHWEQRDAWLEQAIDSVFPGLAVLESNKLSTTTASATVTVTTTAPHGLATGWIVTISGVSSNVEGIPHAQLNKQHAITVTGASTFTITVSTVATGTNAATGGSFFVRHRDLSARKKRDSRATAKKRPIVQRKMVAPREKIAQLSNRIKRDISCPTGMTLVPIQNVNRTVAVEVHIEDIEDATPIKIAKSEMISIFHHEMVTGGICMSEEGHVMVTPLCQGLPKLVRV